MAKTTQRGNLRKCFLLTASAKNPTTIKGVSTEMPIGKYKRAGVSIDALFLKGKCAKITYSGKISPKLRTAIMNANGRNWKKGGMTSGSTWRTGTRVAVVSPSKISFHELVFSRLEDKFRREVKKRAVKGKFRITTNKK